MKNKWTLWMCILGIICSCGSDRVVSKTGKNVSDWSTYDVGTVDFQNLSPETQGAKLYGQIAPDPDQLIKTCARQVLSTLYFSPKDSIPGVRKITYILQAFDGISAKDGNPPAIQIYYSTNWLEKCYKGDFELLKKENEGVLCHELTHGFQLEPQGIGDYGSSKLFRAFIEGMADAVRYVNGGFTLKDRPKGGNYMDGYRATGFFLAWLMQTKDPDFLRKFNRSALEVIPWSFEGAIQYSLGKQYHVDELWKEYLTAMEEVTLQK